ncbi:redoxin domain-containing protein [Legionella sp. W05-934-2]|jgi:peroxiredoxin|uniref:redoxin domain-containing protein n=1 Tax=Legionella sp. W05-934-2 TaxID=1198649 RepID=UPI003462D80D
MIKSILKAVLACCLFVGTSYAAVKVGEKAPDFSLKSVQGKDVKLSDFANKIVVLEWSNFECPFVKKHYKTGNIPAMQKKYKEQGVVWLTVVSSAPGKQGNFPDGQLKDVSQQMGNQANAVLRDDSGQVGKQYGAKTTPQFVIIGKNGVVAYTGAIDSIASTKDQDIEKATNYVSTALDAIEKGNKVQVSSTQPYGCSVKY